MLLLLLILLVVVVFVVVDFYCYFQDFERQQEERSDFLKDKFLKYIDLCVEVDENSVKV